MIPRKPAAPSPTTDVREQALKALSPDDDARTVVGTVLRELYTHHPDVRLDDVLELNAHIDLEPAAPTAPDARDLDAEVQQVLDRALAHLVEWKRPQSTTETRPVPTRKSSHAGHGT